MGYLAILTLIFSIFNFKGLEHTFTVLTERPHTTIPVHTTPVPELSGIAILVIGVISLIAAKRRS